MFNLLNRLRFVFLAMVLFLPMLSGCAGNRTILSEDKKHRQSVTGVIDHSKSKQERDALLVWFVKNDGDNISYEPVARAYHASASAAGEEQTPTMKAVEAAVVELLKGPNTDEEASGVGSEVPRGTVLISIGPTKDQSGIVLNLSKRFLSGSGADSFVHRLEQLKRTVNDIVSRDSEPKAVFLNVEGERLSQATGDGIDVAQPINQ